jgi:predicted transcriptional regulator
VRGGWRGLHNEELHNLYSSPSVISEYEMGRS